MLTVLRVVMILVAIAVLFIVPIRIETASGTTVVDWFAVVIDLVALGVIAAMVLTWLRERRPSEDRPRA